MKIVLIGCFLVLAVSLSVASPCGLAQERVAASKAVTIDGILLRGAPRNLDGAISRYLEREAAFRSRLTLAANAEFPPRSAFEKRQRLERSLFALFDIPDAGQLAAQFVTEGAILYEWEGNASSAMQEAKSALAFLTRNPKTPLAPFVHFFVAHRYVCASEMPFQDTDAKQKEEANKGVPRELNLASQTNQPLLKFVVEDFSRRPRCNDTLDMPLLFKRHCP